MLSSFWVLGFLIFFALFGYGLIWSFFGLFIDRRPKPKVNPEPLTVTMLIAARNEGDAIKDKLISVMAQDISPHQLDILVVSDGSEDNTLEEALSVDCDRLLAFQTETHGGKAKALDAGLKKINSDIVVLSDANSILQPDSLRFLLEPFASSEIGGVCGQPVIEKKRGGWLAVAERLFWRYDSALKTAENKIGGAVSAQGTLYAIRRKLMPDSVPTDMADDLYISLNAVDQGARLAFAPCAAAEEVVTGKAKGEFMRRVRSTERGWRGLMNKRHLMSPFRTGAYGVQLFFHKFLRRMVAFLLPAFLITNLMILDEDVIYLVIAIGQIAFYFCGCAVLVREEFRKIPGASIAGLFVMGHVAMAYGILRALFGIRSEKWSPVRDNS